MSMYWEVYSEPRKIAKILSNLFSTIGSKLAEKFNTGVNLISPLNVHDNHPESDKHFYVHSFYHVSRDWFIWCIALFKL